MEARFGRYWACSLLLLVLPLTTSCAWSQPGASIVFNVTVKYSDDQTLVVGVPVEFGTEGYGILRSPRYKLFAEYMTDDQGKVTASTEGKFRDVIVFFIRPKLCFWSSATKRILREDLKDSSPVDIEIPLPRDTLFPERCRN